MKGLRRVIVSRLLNIAAYNFLLLLTLFALLTIPLSAQFAGGSGTAEDPWQIATPEHLDNIRNYLGEEYSDAYFIQINDIDLGVPPWNENAGWLPIGNSQNESFRGHYDGNSYIIESLYINRVNISYAGLFGYTYGASINNVTITDAVVSGGSNTGILSGVCLSGSSIINTSVSGSISGYDYVGGLVGNSISSNINNVNSAGIVEGVSQIGGLVGQIGRLAGINENASITHGYSTANVYGVNKVGGLIGYALSNTSTHIHWCHSSGNVSGNTYVGGLIGFTYSWEDIIGPDYGKEGVMVRESIPERRGDRDPEHYIDPPVRSAISVINSYSTSQVTGNSWVGGLIGYNLATEVRYCYSEGAVIGSGNWIGGLIGFNSGSLIRNNYSQNSVVGIDYVGGLLGANRSFDDWGGVKLATVQNSFSTGDVVGENNVGGLVGYITYLATVSACYSYSNVYGFTYVGGLLGRSFGSTTVQNSYSKGNIEGENYVGGLIGDIYRWGTVSTCYSDSNISGSSYIGGLVGRIYWYSTLTDTYSRGIVSGLEEHTGGLIGLCQNSSIHNSYSSNIVTGNEHVGGLVGSFVQSSYNFCYWDIDVSGQTTSAVGGGRTTEEMTYPYASNTYLNWDFVNIWSHDQTYFYNDGYPYLAGMPVSVDEEILPPIKSELVIYPNPFNPETTIRLTNTQVIPDELIIYNIKGQTVKIFKEFEQDREGFYITWNGRDDRDRSVASGIYFALVRSKGRDIKSSKMILLK